MDPGPGDGQATTQATVTRTPRLPIRGRAIFTDHFPKTELFLCFNEGQSGGEQSESVTHLKIMRLVARICEVTSTLLPSEETWGTR